MPQCKGLGSAIGCGAILGEGTNVNSSDDIKHVLLDLWEGDAIVLFDWLEWVDFEAIPIRHRAEKQALVDLLN